MKETSKRPAAMMHEPPCELKFGQVGIANLRIKSMDLSAIATEMQMKVKAAPQLLGKAPLVVDISLLKPTPSASEVKALFGTLKQAGVLPVGLAYGTSEVAQIAADLDVPILAKFHAAYEDGPLASVGRNASANASIEREKSNASHQSTREVVHDDDDYLPSNRARTPATPSATAPARDNPSSAMASPADAPVATPAPTPMISNIHTQPIRSGQQIYARGNDLVVVNTVGAGAEVVADGSVHIYGSLRGRALAGARGDVKAQIFCREFQAELVAIAGNYKVMETIPGELRGQAVRIWLEGEEIKIAKLT